VEPTGPGMTARPCVMGFEELKQWPIFWVGVESDYHLFVEEVKMKQTWIERHKARKELFEERRRLSEKLQECQLIYRQYEHMTQRLEYQMKKVVEHSIRLARGDEECRDTATE
jgi:hypothetical protein